MTLAAAELYPGFVAELEAASGVGTGYARSGALHVALDRDEAAELRRVHDLQRSLGLDAEWLPPRRCRELEPGLTPSFNGGVHAPGEASVDPRALTRGAARGARRRGRRGARRGRGHRGPARRRADRRRAHRGGRGAARGRRRPRQRRLVGQPRAGCPSARAPAGAPGQGPDPRAARAGRRSRPASGSSPPSASTSCRAPTAA